MACDLPVHLLEDIFHRLDDVADLARASTACTCFYGVVSDGHFLRRFRSLHRRPVLGFLANDPHETALFYATQPPRRSAQASACFVKAADFNFNFLPDPSHWRVCDVRAGRVLLTRRAPYFRSMFEDLVVYDPLHRRHVQIPTIPGDLVPAGDEEEEDGEAIIFDSPITFDTPFLAPAIEDADDNDDESMLRFQVMCIALTKTEVVAFVFSSGSRQWRRGASFHYPGYDWTRIAYWLWFRQHVHGCVCWVHKPTNLMLVFDTREMKLTMAHLPNIGTSKMAVEAEDGRLGLLVLSKECTAMDLYSKAMEWQGIQEQEEWRYDSSIPIMSGFYWTMLTGVTEGYAFLLGIELDQHQRFIDTYKRPEKGHYFTLDLKTLQVEKLCVLDYDETHTISFLYASFPPLFSSPSV